MLANRMPQNAQLCLKLHPPQSCLARFSRRSPCVLAPASEAGEHHTLCLVLTEYHTPCHTTSHPNPAWQVCSPPVCCFQALISFLALELPGPAALAADVGATLARWGPGPRNPDSKNLTTTPRNSTFTARSSPVCTSFARNTWPDSDGLTRRQMKAEDQRDASDIFRSLRQVPRMNLRPPHPTAMLLLVAMGPKEPWPNLLPRVNCSSSLPTPHGSRNTCRHHPTSTVLRSTRLLASCWIVEPRFHGMALRDSTLREASGTSRIVSANGCRMLQAYQPITGASGLRKRRGAEQVAKPRSENVRSNSTIQL